MKNNVKKFRKEIGLSQKELAQRVKITRPYFKNIENEWYEHVK